MPTETWPVLAAAAAFFLLGVAASPLAWVVLSHRRSRWQQQNERRFQEIAGEVRALADRLERYERIRLKQAEEPFGPTGPPGPWPLRTSGAKRVSPEKRAQPLAVAVAGPGPDEPPLIAVPSLAASHDREVVLGEIKQRHAAIWSLADSGAPPEVIARATGQPVGQIELILGLRRQINGTRTKVPHASSD